VWIFAGYKKPLETLFEHNEGLPSRFPLRFVFQDYSNEELQKIFEDMMMYLPPQVEKKPKGTKVKRTSSRTARLTPFHCDKKHLELAIKRLGRRRGRDGFGNARAVRMLFDKVIDDQASRIAGESSQSSSKVDIFLLTKQDLLGPDVTPDSLKKSQAWKDLKELEGITVVKEQVERLFNLVLRNADREKRGEEPLTVSLNR
jgi:hypothetical protein